MAEKTSPVWLYYTLLEKDKSRCDICKSILSHKGGSSSNLRKHLKSKHPTLDVDRKFAKNSVLEPKDGNGGLLIMESKTADDVRASESNIISAGFSEECAPSRSRDRSNKKQGTLQNYVVRPITMPRQKAITAAILEMIVTDVQPFSIVEDEGFKRLIKLMDPSYELPSRSHLSQSLLPRLFETVEVKIFAMLQEAEFVALTTDTWTSISNQGYMAVTAHFILPNWSQMSVLLECVHITESHTAVNLKDELDKIVSFFKIECKVTAVTTDNAANIKAAIRLTNWVHVPCFAHTLNLIVQEATKKTIQELTHKVKSIVSFFHRSTTANEKFFAMQRQMNPERTPLKLMMDVITRWNSSFYMYERVCLLQEPIEATLGLLHSPVASLTSEDWDVMREVCRVLKPFDIATIELSAEKNVSLSKVLVMVAGITRAVRAPKIKIATSLGQQLVGNLLRAISFRYENIQMDKPSCMAAFLDPRFKHKAFESEDSLKAVEERLMTEMDSSMPQQASEIEEIFAGFAEDDNNLLWSYFDSTMQDVKTTSSISTSQIEIQNYKCDAFVERTKNPLDFWKTKGHLYPRLQNISKKWLAIPATSVPSERVFSKAGQLISEKRNRLKPENVQRILFLNANLKVL